MAGDNWNSLDDLFCDLIQDPLISSLINNVPESVPSAISPVEADSSSNQTNTNWRPWSPLDDPHRTLVPPTRETPPTSPQTPPLSHPSLSMPTVFARPNHSQANPHSDRPSSIPLSGLNFQPKLSPATPTSPPTSSNSFQTQCSTMFQWPDTYRRGYGSNDMYTTPDYSQIVDVEIIVNANIRDVQLYGKRGVVRRVSVQNIANVHIYDLHQEVKIPCSYLQQVAPSQNDFVKVISGINKGCVGMLVSSVNQSAIVQLHGPYRRNLYQFNLNHLGKYVPKGLLSRGGSAQSPTTNSPLSSSPHSLYPSAYSNGVVRNNPFMPQQRFCSAAMRSTYAVRPVNSVDVLKEKVSSFLAYGNMHKVSQQQQQNIAMTTRSSMLELLEELIKKPSPKYDFSCMGEVGEVKTSCVRVSLICPLSQRRMSYPCRGNHCKHPQCFDAEAYIEFNRSQKLKGKIKNGVIFQPVADRRWKCPLCHKFTPFHHLYVDRTLLRVTKDTTVTEVEFDKSGSWKPVEKAEAAKGNVIDLTLDDSDDEAGPS